MNKLQRAKFVEERLEAAFPHPEIPLDSLDDYTFLTAVMLSAQCTDKRVNEVTPKLFAVADTPEKMAKLSESEIREIIKPCGLSNSKAKNILQTAKILRDKYAGKVPRTFEELEALPGVGHKTASVMMVQAFGTPAFPVDTHIHRLAKRWKLSDGSSVEQTEKDLKKLFPKEKWGALHLQFIYYGRTFCKAHTCKTPETMCEICAAINAKK